MKTLRIVFFLWGTILLAVFLEAELMSVDSPQPLLIVLSYVSIFTPRGLAPGLFFSDAATLIAGICALMIGFQLKQEKLNVKYLKIVLIILLLIFGFFFLYSLQSIPLLISYLTSYLLDELNGKSLSFSSGLAIIGSIGEIVSLIEVLFLLSVFKKFHSLQSKRSRSEVSN